MEMLSRDPHRVNVTDVVRLYLNPAADADLLARALDTEALPLSWRDYLRQKADALLAKPAAHGE